MALTTGRVDTTGVSFHYLDNRRVMRTPEHRIGVPFEEVTTRLCRGASRKPERAPLQLAVVLAVVEVGLELAADPDTALTSHRDVPTIEQGMDVGSHSGSPELSARNRRLPPGCQKLTSSRSGRSARNWYQSLSVTATKARTPAS